MTPTDIEKLKELATIAKANVPAGDNGDFFQESHDSGEKPEGATELSELLCFFNDEGKPRVWAWDTVGKFIAAASPNKVLSLIAALEAAQGEVRTLRNISVSNAEALEAAQANVKLWSDYPTISAKLLDRERAREAEQRTCREALEQVAAKDAEIEGWKSGFESCNNARIAAEAALKEAREAGVIIDREHLRNLLKILRNYPNLASVKAAEALLSKQDSGERS